MTANGYRGFFESDGNVLKFIVIIVVQLYEHAKKMLDYIP